VARHQIARDPSELVTVAPGCNAPASGGKLGRLVCFNGRATRLLSKGAPAEAMDLRGPAAENEFGVRTVGRNRSGVVTRYRVIGLIAVIVAAIFLVRRMWKAHSPFNREHIRVGRIDLTSQALPSWRGAPPLRQSMVVLA